MRAARRVAAVAALAATLFGTAACRPAAPVVAGVPAQVDFNFHVRPILSDKCFACHGPDDRARKGGLSLHTKDGAFAALANGHRAVVPGDTGKSELVRRILSTDPAVLMPQPESHLALSEIEKATLVRWIEQGATWTPHWAFLPPKRVAVPTGAGIGTAANPIDAFVRADLARHGPDAVARGVARDADPSRLDRPHRPAADDRRGRCLPGRHERRGLREGRRPAARLAGLRRAHGRRLARRGPLRRLARLPGRRDAADVAVARLGDQGVQPRTCRSTSSSPGSSPATCCPTRRPSSASRPRSTATTCRSQEGGIVSEEYRVEYVADRVNTFGSAFLGLTIQCARCHDHKYDPVLQKDYFKLFAFFNNVNETGQIPYSGMPSPTVTLSTPAADAALATLRAAIGPLEEATRVDRLATGPAFEAWLREGPGRASGAAPSSSPAPSSICRWTR